MDDQELIEVSKSGDIDALYASLGKRPTILDEINSIRFINTPLHWAVIAGHTSFAIEIANLMPSFTMKLNPDGLCPLHLASANGNLEIVKELLKVENDLCNLKGRERRTPLHCAAIAGHINVLKELLSTCPFCITHLTLKRETALHLALKNDQVEVFKTLVNLLRYHWQHDLLSDQDHEGNTVLHLAILRGHHHEVVEFLLHHCNLLVKNAVQVNVKNKDGLTALDILLDQKVRNFERAERILRGVGAKRARDIIAKKLNSDGLCPLHLASTNGNLEIVKELLKVDNDLCNLKGRERRTPLHCAAIAGHINVLKELLSNSPFCITHLTLKSETALHLALKHDQVEVFKTLVNLLRYHWQYDLLSDQDHEGNTVLHLANLRGHHEVVELLLHHSNLLVKNVVQVNVKNKDGLTALDILLDLKVRNFERVERMLRGVGAKRACDIIAYFHELVEVARNGDIDALYALLGKRPTILDEIDRIEFNNTPLHWAVLGDQISFVVEIANLKPSFTRKLNQDGYSPLHLASMNGNVEIVKELIVVDQNLRKLKGREGRIPLHCAIINGHINVSKILLLWNLKSIEDLTQKKETAFHLALKYDQVEVFKALVNWIYGIGCLIYHHLLSCQDQDGNTVFHLAIIRGHHKVVEMLLVKQRNIFIRNVVQVNIKNNHELTALDLLRLSEFPANRGGIRDEQQEKRSSVERILGEAQDNERKLRIGSGIFRFVNNIAALLVRYFVLDSRHPIEARNDLLVVAVLVVTATYQTVITPPGGLWQDDTTDDQDHLTPTHHAGDAILATNSPFVFFIIILSNYIGFVLSCVLLSRLAPGYPYRLPLLIALLFMWFTCTMSTSNILWGLMPLLACLPFLVIILTIVVMILIRKYGVPGSF
ncbi:ankyrin-1-like [Telopea speciosissima]|uniref:ankyrin-1-like n=1 Tax=Telopea speciosissima TaxID=54955 RepID=UPI001CC6CF7A|nr:ankyrin-1-like [Telopea speciosissima]